VLLVWRSSFEAPRIDGRRLFGDRYLVLRNEELRSDPAAALGRIYAAPAGARHDSRRGYPWVDQGSTSLNLSIAWRCAQLSKFALCAHP